MTNPTRFSLSFLFFSRHCLSSFYFFVPFSFSLYLGSQCFSFLILFLLSSFPCFLPLFILFSFFLSLFSFSLVSFPSFDLKSRELRREVCGPFSLRHCVRPFSSLVHLVSLSLLVHVSTGSSSLPPFPSLVLLLTPFSLSLYLSLSVSLPISFLPSTSLGITVYPLQGSRK